MAFFVSVTRLRLRSPLFLPGFALHAVRSNAQVVRAQGFRGGALMPDRKLTFWTSTVWEGREAMRAFMTSGAHLKAMPRLLDWCDQASVVHWEQADATLPPGEEAEARMRGEGRASKVRHPAPDHAALAFAPARFSAFAPLSPKLR